MSSRLPQQITMAVGLVCFTALIVMALMTLNKRPDPAPKAVVAPLVEVLSLTSGTIEFSVASQGSVAPLTQTTLSAEVAGTIVSVSDSFVAGGSFNAGEVLLRIDPTNYRVAVERAQAAVSQRQIEFDGAEKLNREGYRAEAELLSAKAALAAANADLVRAQRDLERSVVRVPYAGLVRTRSAQLGDYVAPGTALGTVFSTDAVEVRLPLPDTDLAFVSLPRTGSDDAKGPAVTLNGQYQGREASWRARIVRTEGVVDERNRMVFAVARLDDPYRRDGLDGDATPLPIGTFVSAAIEGISVDNVVSIPRELVRGNDQVIFIDDEQKLRFRDLEFLRKDGRFAYVLADQLSEMQVVTTVLEAPLNGQKVRREDADVRAATSTRDDDIEVSGPVDSEVDGDTDSGVQ